MNGLEGVKGKAGKVKERKRVWEINQKYENLDISLIKQFNGKTTFNSLINMKMKYIFKEFKKKIRKTKH